MILRGQPRGKVGRCRDFFLKKPVESGLNLFPQAFFVSDLAVCCSFDKMPLSVL